MAGLPNVDLAVDVGATSCVASFNGSQADAYFNAGGGAIFFDAYVHTTQVNDEGRPRGLATLEGDVTDMVTFYGVPPGSTLSLEWFLLVSRFDSTAIIDIVGERVLQPGLNSKSTNVLSIINDSVGIMASISAQAYGSLGIGHWILFLGIDESGLQHSHVLDTNGNRLTGFTYSTASGRPFYIPDGVQVESIPEPSTWALLVVPFLWIATRRRSVSRRD